MNERPYFSIIIPTYNRVDELTLCINGLLKQDFDKEKYEIIVVDSSKDKTKHFIKNISRKNRNIKYFFINRGGAATARNLGIKQAEGKVICFIDDDACPSVSWLSNFYKSFENNEKIAGVCGCTYAKQSNSKLPQLLEKHVYNPHGSYATNNICYKKSYLKKVGYFDYSFKSSWEDVDLGFRIKSIGGKILFNEDAVAYHHHEDTFKVYKRKCYLNGVGLSNFFKKFVTKKPYVVLNSMFNDFKNIILFPSLVIDNDESKGYLLTIRSFYTILGFFHGLFNGQLLMSKNRN